MRFFVVVITSCSVVYVCLSIIFLPVINSNEYRYHIYIDVSMDSDLN